MSMIILFQGVSIRIEYMDRSQAPSGGWHHDFLVDGDIEPKLFFLVGLMTLTERFFLSLSIVPAIMIFCTEGHNKCRALVHTNELI
jgi:hypothetical protein